MKKENCKHWDYCSAPLCPKDIESLKNGIWYPDEEICREVPSPLWVKRQKKIMKRYNDGSKFFTISMLEHDFIIRKGIKGINPEKGKEREIIKWFLKHPKKSFKTFKKRLPHGDNKRKKVTHKAILKY